MKILLLILFTILSIPNTTNAMEPLLQEREEFLLQAAFVSANQDGEFKRLADQAAIIGPKISIGLNETFRSALENYLRENKQKIIDALSDKGNINSPIELTEVELVLHKLRIAHTYPLPDSSHSLEVRTAFYKQELLDLSVLDLLGVWNYNYSLNAILAHAATTNFSFTLRKNDSAVPQ